jgi:hypothetical protein
VTIALETTLSRNEDILHAAVNADELVMLSMSSNCYYGVNSVGARIWELLETPTTVGQICTRLCEEFEVDRRECQSAVLKFVNELVGHGLINAT